MNALAITLWTSTPDELAQFIPRRDQEMGAGGERRGDRAGVMPNPSDRHDILPLLSSPRKRRPIVPAPKVMGVPRRLRRGVPLAVTTAEFAASALTIARARACATASRAAPPTSAGGARADWR